MSMNPRLLRPLASGFNPRQIAGLVGWWDSTDNATITTDTGVSAWSDKSGSGYTLTQSTGANQPTISSINGKQAFDYNGSSQFLQSTAAALAANASGADRPPLSFFYVAEFDAVAQAWPVGFASSASLQPVHYALQPDASNLWRTAYRHDSFTFVGANSSATYTAGSAYVVSSQTGNTIVGRVNGSEVVSTANTSTGTITVNQFNIGVLARSSLSGFVNGRIGDVLIYNRVLSASEIALVERWLAGKFGVTLA